MNEFVKNPSSKTWSLTVGFDLQKMPAIVGWREGEPTILTCAVVEADRLDGSTHDSDGCEKEFNITADYEFGTLTFETLKEDEAFWVGTEKNCRGVGMLGYYSYLINEDLQTIDEHEEIEAMAMRDEDGRRPYPEVFIWARGYVQNQAPGLLSAPRQAARP
jgi:hypothetical protein